MPILPSIAFDSISDQQFAAIDQSVMRCAYAVHNKLGRHFDEKVYENDLALRLRAEGHEVFTQVPVAVFHSSFRKTYYLDMAVDHVIYELKVVTSLSSEHEAQALQYAMFQDVRLVKLINFGDSKVQGRLLFNALRKDDRYHSEICFQRYRALTPKCERLVFLLEELIKDFGTHLSNQLYNDAFIDFFGGENECVRRLELHAEQVLLGSHSVQLYAPNCAFVISTLSRDQVAYSRHLKVLMDLTSLYGIQWINFNRSKIELTTISHQRKY